MSSNRTHYSLFSIVLHWLSALTVFGLFGAGIWMVELTYYSEWYRVAPHYHKSVGLTLAALTVIRLIWKRMKGAPSPLAEGWQKTAASFAHSVLYLLLFALFVSGYLISTADGRGIEVFNWFTLPSSGEWVTNQEDVAGLVHEWLAYGLMALVTLHVAGALKHHFVDKDLTLIRMLRPSSKTAKHAQTDDEEE